MENTKAIVLSSIYGKTDFGREIIYKVKVKETDRYLFYTDIFACFSITCNGKNEILKDGVSRLLHAGEILYIKIRTFGKNYRFCLHVDPLKLKNFTPFKIKTTRPNYNEISEPTIIKYNKRKGGTYLYSNVPESMDDQVLNSIIMENNNLKGDVFLTFEHQNKTSKDKIYMGYFLTNVGSEDAYITILNLGYQVDGSWLGEKSWSNYYGVKYDMSIKSFNEAKQKYANDYFNFDNEYKPHIFSPTTFLLKRGEKIFVIGGCEEDNLHSLAIYGSTNKYIGKNCCVNGNVLFNVAKGKIKGSLVVFDDDHHDFHNFKVQNFRSYGENDDMGGRLGKANHQGVIDATMAFRFNDQNTGLLKVAYNNYYADELKEQYEPFEKIDDIKEHLVIADSWKTHLSAELHHDYIGTDMVENEVLYKDKKIILSVDRANPKGQIWDFGNWMIEYQDNMYFKNEGDKKRCICLYILNSGSLFYIVKNRRGKILKAKATFLPCSGEVPAYKFYINPHSTKFVSLQYVLPANDNGSIEHKVKII